MEPADKTLSVNVDLTVPLLLPTIAWPMIPPSTVSNTYRTRSIAFLPPTQDLRDAANNPEHPLNVWPHRERRSTSRPATAPDPVKRAR